MVTTWILILSLFSTTYHGGPALTSVGPFASREECMRAGNLWLHQIHSETLDSDSGWPLVVKPKALCVYTTALEQTVTYGARE